MNIKLKQNSWHSNLYESLYEEDLPDNLCPYFWKVIIALITLPFWCIVHKVELPSYDKITCGIGFECIIYLLGTIFASIYVEILNTDIVWLYYLSPIAGILITVLFIGTILGIVFIISLIIDKIKETKHNKAEPQSLIGAKIYAVKNKICPKINWK